MALACGREASLVASSPIAASIVSLCSSGKKQSATVVISSWSASTDGPPAAGAAIDEARQAACDAPTEWRGPGPSRRPPSSASRAISADERRALAEEVDVAVDQHLECGAQLAAVLELGNRARRDRLEPRLALGEQPLEHGPVERLLAAEEVGRQRGGDAGAPPISPRLAPS